MQNNKSPLTVLAMHDQFAKPQSNSIAALLKNLPQNTVFMHTALFSSNIVEQDRLEKNNVKKKRMAKVQNLFRAIGCVQIRFPVTSHMN